MNFLKKVSRKVAPVKVWAKKHSPEILLGVGIVTMVGAVITSAIAGSKIDDIMDEHDEELAKAKEDTYFDEEEQVEVEKDESDVKHDVTMCYIHTWGKLALAFAPTVALMGVSTASFIAMHNIQATRFASLSTAYTGLNEAFMAYRQRNIELNGEENDRMCRFGYKTVDVVDEEGKTVGKQNVPKTARDYSDAEAEEMHNGFIVFGPNTSPAFTGIYSMDKTILDRCEEYLRSQAIAGLEPVANDMFDFLSMKRTDEGMVMGWDKEHLPELHHDDPCNPDFSAMRSGYKCIYLMPNCCVNVFQKRHRERKVFDAQTDGIFKDVRNAV